nr:hypothetical protein [Tanacetum cinerariifolium]
GRYTPSKKRLHWCTPLSRKNNGVQEESENNGERVNMDWKYLSLNDWLQIRFGKVSETDRKKILIEYWRYLFRIDYDDIDDFDNPDRYKESKSNEIRELIISKLHEEWFKVMSDDEDDIEGIIDYLKPISYDGFIDLEGKAYKKRRSKLLGMPYIEPPPIIIKKVKITRYNIGPEEVYTKMKIFDFEEIPQTRGNIATIRARIMDEISESYREGESNDKT